MSTAGNTALAASQPLEDLRFLVSRNDSEIGYHNLAFSESGDQLTVDIDIELKVKIAFITVYEYTHRNRERWQAGKLVGFDSQTDDNGAAHRVTAEVVGDELIIDGSEGRVTAPADIMPTTYWHRSFMQQTSWVDTQSGRIIQGTVEPGPRESIAAAGGSIEAERYALRGDLDIDLWYQDDRWVKLGFNTKRDGSRIDYKMVSPGPFGALTNVPGATVRS